MTYVRESQFDEEHYYIIAESEFNNNYLKSLFQSFFSIIIFIKKLSWMKHLSRIIQFII